MNGLLICTGEGKYKNIGDYIQSLAQEQFWNHIDINVEREFLSKVESELPINLIMNSWYMWHPENFPPSSCINPLFVSFHISPSVEEAMMTPQTVEYLKKHAPIGARDIGTLEILKRHGVDSYFSGCLTLTLGQHYKTEECDDSIYFVDPYFEYGEKNIFEWFLPTLYWTIKYYRVLKRLKSKFVCFKYSKISRVSKSVDRLFCLASFYKAYSSLFTKEVLLNATYVKHMIKRKTKDNKLEYARELVKKYAKARLVVTSRIHSALPCVGLETPVLFVNSKYLENGKYPDRFRGLKDFFNMIDYSKGKLIPSSRVRSFMNGNMIETTTKISNPDTYLPYKMKLIHDVEEFVRRCEQK